MEKKSKNHSLNLRLQRDSFVNLGECKYYTKCRFCLSSNITDVIDLGNVPLAGGFIKKNAGKNVFSKEKLYPLKVSFCNDCFLLQCSSTVKPEILFKDYFYHTSSINSLVSHFDEIAKEISSNISKGGYVLEIGSNDGPFLKSLSKYGVKNVGVDPAVNIVKKIRDKDINIYNDYFSEKFSKKIKRERGQAEIVASFHTLAHIEDMHDTIKGIKNILKENGTLIFEVHYLGNLIKETQYDMIYHEHLYYYSVTALKNFFSLYNMEIVDLRLVNQRGGSVIYYVKNNNKKNVISLKVHKLLRKEKEDGLLKIETFIKYSGKILRTKKDILKLLTSYKKKKYVINGYGASGRGTIIMNYVGIGKNFLNCVVDDAPAKKGAYMPGNHLKITDSIPKDTQYLVLFAWPFLEEIRQKKNNYLTNGGKFILPLPEVKIIEN